MTGKEKVFVELDSSFDVAVIEAAKLLCIHKCRSVFIVRELKENYYGAFAGSDMSWLFGGFEGYPRRVILNMERHEFVEAFGSVVDRLLAH